jgi:hypothetical protein
VIPLTPIAGVIIDPETETFAVFGRRLPVASVMHFEGSPGGPRNEEVLEIMERSTSAAAFDMEYLRTTESPPSREAVHLNVLAGENGWWIEVHVYPEDGEVDANLPTEDWEETRFNITAEELITFYEEICRRPDAPVIDDEWLDPYCGLAPGTWLW